MAGRRQTMAAADAAWLRMDSADNPMVIQVVVWFDRPLDRARAEETLKGRWVEPFRRFRQRPAADEGLGRRHWEESSRFRLSDHIRHVELPAPGDLASLQAYVSGQAALRLEKIRPLWEVHFLHGFGGGSAALIRMHHALADGHMLARLLRELDESQPQTDPTELAAQTERSARRAERVPPLYRVLAHGVDLLTHPRRAAHEALDLAAIGSVAVSDPEGAEALHASLSGRKSLRWLPSLKLEELRHCARAQGVTLNDLFMAAIAGGLRAYVRESGASPGDLRVVTPVDLREPGEPLGQQLGNHFGLAFAMLPSGLDDPRSRLRRMHRRMNEVKESETPRITFESICVAGRTGGSAPRDLIRLFARGCTAIVSNVRGPADPIVWGGVPVAGFAGFVPTSASIGLGFLVSSYAGQINLGLRLDDGVIQHPDRLAAAVQEELAALRDL